MPENAILLDEVIKLFVGDERVLIRPARRKTWRCTGIFLAGVSAEDLRLPVLCGR